MLHRILYINRHLRKALTIKANILCIYPYKAIRGFEVLRQIRRMSGKLSIDALESFQEHFREDPKNLLAQNVISRADPLDSCLQRKGLEPNHIFSHKVSEVKPISNQKSSGRCWIFAALNAMRIPFVKDKNLEEFEFSQAYLFFWDKIERSNYFLNSIADTYNRVPKEDPEGRLVGFLLNDPICDGGQWDMLVNLIEKHGVVPRNSFAETYSCEKSAGMNGILKSKLQEFAHDIHKCIDAGNDEVSVKSLITEQMKTIFRIVSICLGSPPKDLTWEYYDKSKKYQKIEKVSPLQFYIDHVKPSFDVNSKVCLVNDPRPKNSTGKTYTVDCLGNVVGGRKTIYNNQPIETLMEVAAKSIKAGEPVWFGCDVGKHMASKEGSLDLQGHDYRLVYGIQRDLNLSKANRLIYGTSLMTHAMVFTGVGMENYEEASVGKQNGTVVESKEEIANVENIKMENITKWRVENSWGEDKHEKGYLVMTNEWFREFVFEVVVDKKYCSEEILRVFDTEPEVLPAWDPMGALAK